MSSIESSSRRASIKGDNGMRLTGEAKAELDTVNMFCKIMKKMQSISEGA